jgi:hypothetical protein
MADRAFAKGGAPDLVHNAYAPTLFAAFDPKMA